MFRVVPLIGIIAGCTTKNTDTGVEEDSLSSAVEDSRCETAFYYATDTEPDGVLLAGEFNDWATDEHELQEWAPGQWGISIPVEPGVYAYQFIEFTEWEHDGALLWTCDSAATLAVCDESTTHDLEWAQDCAPGRAGCNSMIRIDGCESPKITVDTMDTSDGILRLSGSVQTKAGTPAEVQVYLNDEPLPVTTDGSLFHVEQVAISEGRHFIDITAVDELGFEAEPHYIPFWNDDWTPEKAVIYHALIDRVANGDTNNDQSEETTHAITDWAGGDLAGLIASLPYLDSLGINTIWLSNPQAGPSGAWGGDCNATYSSYHGFWPKDWDSVDPHLGTMDDLDAFIAAAHDRGMRVWMDWVGNHVHSEHPLAVNTNQFHAQAICKHTNWEGVSNWDLIPESCWFTDYMPDWDHSDTAVIDSVVEMAVDWAKRRHLDGLRVDAAKHMSHAVVYNLRSRTEEALVPNGSDFVFPLIGETFDQAPLIKAYIGDDQLHGQFDFPLYWAIRSAFIDESIAVKSVVQQAAAVESNYNGGMMSTFLGNLDVSRFLTAAHEFNGDVCPDGSIRQAGTPDDGLAFDRLRLAWTLLFTQPGMPLVYYGDEFGLPGYGDPDNRQPLWWHNADLKIHDAQSLQGELPSGPARVLETVRRLSAARAEHPSLRGGTQTEWWDDGGGLYATAHERDGDQAIVILNRTGSEQWLENGLSFAGLREGQWTDVLTDDVFTAVNDQLTISVPAYSPRVLVAAEEDTP